MPKRLKIEIANKPTHFIQVIGNDLKPTDYLSNSLTVANILKDIEELPPCLPQNIPQTT